MAVAFEGQFTIARPMPFGLNIETVEETTAADWGVGFDHIPPTEEAHSLVACWSRLADTAARDSHQTGHEEAVALAHMRVVALEDLAAHKQREGAHRSRLNPAAVKIVDTLLYQAGPYRKDLLAGLGGSVSLGSAGHTDCDQKIRAGYAIGLHRLEGMEQIPLSVDSCRWNSPARKCHAGDEQVLLT